MSETQYTSIAQRVAKYAGQCKKCGKPIVKDGPLFMYNGSRCADAGCAATGPAIAPTPQQPLAQPARAPQPARAAPPAQAPQPTKPAPAQQHTAQPTRKMTVSEAFDKIDTFAQIHEHAMNFALRKSRDIYPGDKDERDRRITASVIYNRSIDFVINA